MKILKVIVDEVPDGCLYCDLSSVWDSTKSKCRLNGKKLFYENKSERPDWCPLVAEASLEKEVVVKGGMILENTILDTRIIDE